MLQGTAVVGSGADSSNIGTIIDGVICMDQEKRKGDKPVPENITRFLNELQILALRRVENFGWRLQFIRRPLFQEPVVVVIDGEGKKIGILEDDGRINMAPDIKIRE